jgi:hypothetical protein
MSEHRPNWAEETSAISNLLQNVQLKDLHLALQDAGKAQDMAMRLALGEHQTKVREDALREKLWQLESALNPWLNNPAVSPCAKFLFARQIQSTLAQANITTDSFRQFADKDRLGAFISRVQQAMDEAKHQMSIRQSEEVETYLRYQTEQKELSELLELEAARQSDHREVQEQAALKRKINDLRKKQEAIRVGYGRTPRERFLYLGLPIGLVYLLNLLAVFMLPISDDGISAVIGIPGMVALVAICGIPSALVFGGFVALVFKLIRECFSPQTAIVGRWQTQIEKLEAKLVELDEEEDEEEQDQPWLESRRLALSEKFGTSNTPHLVQQKQERDVFVEQFRQANNLALEDQTNATSGLAIHDNQALGRISIQQRIEASKRFREQKPGTDLAEGTNALEPTISRSGASRQADDQDQEDLCEADQEQEQEERQQELEMMKGSPGVGVVLLVMSIGMLIWCMNSCGIIDQTRIVTEADGIWGFVLFFGAIVIFVVGIMMFFVRRSKDAVSAGKPKAQRGRDKANG